MNVHARVQVIRPFAKGASTITQSPRSILSLVCTAGAVAAAITLTPSLASGAATIYNLGALGGTYSRGYAVNNAGQVTGWSDPSGDTASHAYRYDGTPDSGGAMRNLGTPVGGTYSVGRGINNAGQVAGQSGNAGAGAFHAFRYDGTPGSGGVMRDLGTLGGTASAGRAVNNAGQVTGESW